jgi:hypothetical protein
MKIKKLVSICKLNKTAIIYERKTGEVIQQYIGDGNAFYPIYGLPRLTKESLLTIFDIAQEDWDKWKVRVQEAPPKEFTDDLVENEEPISKFYQQIVINGELIKSMCMPNYGTVFYKDAYMGPIRDGEEIMFYGRYCGEEPIIAVKSGLLLQATILPTKIESDILWNMKGMLSGCRDIEAQEEW